MSTEICQRCGRPVLHPANGCRWKEEHAVTVAVRHSYYGCDTGCCGHEIVGYDAAGEEVSRDFDFGHADEDEDKRDYAHHLAQDKLRRATLDWERCEILTYDECGN